jgi:aminoglycoside phosphotransferase
VIAVAARSLAPDAAVPHRDALLDASAMGRRLAERLAPDAGLALEECALVRVKYRLGVRLRSVYRLRLGGCDRYVAASTFPTRERCASAAARALPPLPAGPLRPIAVDEGLLAVYWAFPNDRRLAGLDVLAAGPGALADAVGAAPAGVRLVAYAPEKAATVRLEAPDGRPLAYAKLYAGADAARTARVHAELRAAGIAVPPMLAARHSRLLVVAPAAGTPVAALGGAAATAAHRALGAAVARLHRVAPPADRRFARLEPEALAAAADLVERARPDVRVPLRALLRDLARRRPAAGADACLHGDVHPKNALTDGRRLVLIDLDQVAAGPAAAELGSALAGLAHRRTTGLVSPEDERRLRRAFLRGYAGVAPLPADAALRWHTAAALLAERALRSVNRIRPDGLAHLEDTLLAARGLLR